MVYNTSRARNLANCSIAAATRGDLICLLLFRTSKTPSILICFELRKCCFNGLIVLRQNRKFENSQEIGGE